MSGLSRSSSAFSLLNGSTTADESPPGSGPLRGLHEGAAGVLAYIASSGKVRKASRWVASETHSRLFKQEH
jgi:hypothetical protein